MRARLILEHGGHAITKRVELPEARGEADVYLREDALDLKMQTIPDGAPGLPGAHAA
ncbi:hypothetical protein [Sorangium cellulosum]|uniref:hypothetical protein n=1 Tax=Sorangium cellulosum TaxID=56 RepID=UPI000A6DCD4F|nr:hypothetical protein [Sorangium cellulosum]